jgi:hypothetical protein
MPSAAALKWADCPPAILLRQNQLAPKGLARHESEFFIPQQTPNAFFVPLIAATLLNHEGTQVADRRHTA